MADIDDALAGMVAAVRGNPVAMLNLARTLLLPKGKVELAAALCDEAVALAPSDAEVSARARTIRSNDVGGWYFTMVQDEPRHRLYAEAFRQRLTPGCTVLDIGAGTGLFAMLAAREGAGRVIACERNPVVAQAARQIVERNGLSDKITIVTKDSKDLEIGVDLEEPADILLWDNLANNLLGVGAADTVEDAKRRLIKPDAPIIPARAEIVVAPVRDKRPDDRTMSIVDGFDMTPFNALSGTNLTIGQSRLERLGEAVTLFKIDFESDAPISAERRSVTVETRDGRIDGVAQWLRFHLSDTVVYDTSGATVTAFGTQYHPVEPVDVTKGQTVTIVGAHDRVHTWFWLARS